MEFYSMPSNDRATSIASNSINSNTTTNLDEYDDHPVILNMHESRLDLIVLYNNMVQINRKWKVNLRNQVGVTTCCLRGLPASLKNLRIYTMNHHHIVQVSTRFYHIDISKTPIPNLKSQLDSKKHQLKSSELNMSRIITQKASLEAFNKSLLSSSAEASRLSESSVKGLNDFLVLYSDTGANLDKQRLTTEIAIKNTQNCIASLSKQLEEEEAAVNEQQFEVVVVINNEHSAEIEGFTINSAHKNHDVIFSAPSTPPQLSSSLSSGAKTLQASPSISDSPTSKGNRVLNLYVSYTLPVTEQWTPQYTVNVDTTHQRMRLLYQAAVFNTTSESWKDAKIILCNTSPSLSSLEAPTLNAWSIGPKSKMPPPNLTSSIDGKMSKPRGSKLDDPELGQVKKGGETVARVNSVSGLTVTEESTDNIQTYSVRYHASGLVNVPNDGKPHLVTITSNDLLPALKWIVSPRIDTTTFLRTRVKNESENILLPGPANVFIDGAFTANSYIKRTFPHEDIEMPLGADSGIGIVYRPLKKVVETTPGGILVGKMTVAKYIQVIDVKNDKKLDVALTVQDHIPISSSDSGVKVALLSPQLSSNKTRTEHADEVTLSDVMIKFLEKEGKLEYLIRMRPGARRSIEFVYEVVCPVNDVIEGL